MHVIDFVADLPPALVLGALAVVYLVGYFIRRNVGYLVLGAVGFVCISMMVTPGGREVLNRAQQQPDTLSKTACVGAASAAFIPWTPDAQTKIKDVGWCNFRGQGVGGSFGGTGEADRLIDTNGAVLLKRYGRPPVASRGD